MSSELTVNTRLNIVPIGKVISPFKQKFTVPRQPRLLNLAKGYIELNKPFNDPHALLSLTEFSHIWVLFWFHLNPENKAAGSDDYKWQPMVRPPRLGGKEKVGVFATRSPFRPNPIGLSVYEIDKIEQIGTSLRIYINGIDVVHGTPVIDIKPYIPFSDSVNEAKGGFAEQAPNMPFNVSFSEEALANLLDLVEHQGQTMDYANDVKAFILQVLSQDARPSYHHSKANDFVARQYGVDLLDYNIKWLLSGNEVIITQITFSS